MIGQGLTDLEYHALSNASFIKGKVGALMPQWDWYQATIAKGADDLIESACNEFPDHDFRADRGIAQYENCLVFFRHGVTDRSFEINYGGNSGAAPNVKATGSNAPAVADWLRKCHAGHRVTRMDSKVDMWGEGLADQIFEDMDRIHASTPRLKRDTRGFGSPENGRTYYLGTRTSRVYVRAYEKGLEQGLGAFVPHRSWFRVEVEIKPPKVHDGVKASTVTPLSAFGMSNWSNRLICDVLQREPEPYEWSRRVEPTPIESLKLLYHQRRKTFRNVGLDAAIELLREEFKSDFPTPEVEFVSPDGEVVSFQGSFL